MTAPTDVGGFALGALPPKEDPRTLRLGAYLPAALPTPPAAVDWTTKVGTWPMYRNNRVSCCTCAAAGHAIGAWTSNASTDGAASWITDQDVIAAYTTVSGYDPATGFNDRGAYLLDVLNLWRRRGVGGRRITAYARVNILDLVEVRTAIAQFGALYSALALPVSADDQLRANAPWKAINSSRGRPGSWGGHAVSILGYDRAGLVCATWGREQRMTWGFWSRYGREAYAAFGPDWMTPAGPSVSGFNTDQMLADLRTIGAA